MTPLELVLSKFPDAKRIGAGFQVKCPSHDDRKASLSITEAADGKVLFYCHAGCSLEAILEAVGLKLQDLFPREPESREGKITAVYPYEDENGKTLFEVCRYFDKTFKQRRPDGFGGYIYSLKGVRRVLYRLPKIKPAIDQGALIFIVEGEKDCHAVESLGCVGTCNSAGAGNWIESYSDSLRGAEVIILPDNDGPGDDHARKVAAALQGHARRVRVLRLPDLPPKGDVSDWIAAGGTRDELLKLAEECPDWEPSEVRQEELPATIFPFTDLGNSERFISAYGHELKFDVNQGTWLIWNGVRWEYNTTHKVDQLAHRIVRDMRLDAAIKDMPHDQAERLFKHSLKSESAPRLTALLGLARKLSGVSVGANELDCDPWMFNILNGTLDLRTGKVQPHCSSDLITKLSSVEYQPDADCPRWTRFLSEVFSGNVELIGFIQRMCGYFLAADIREQSFFVFWGKGANGKSVFVEVLRGIFGDYGADTPTSTFLERRGDNSTNDLAALAGRRLVTAAEGGSSSVFNESLIKRLSGGDPITARFLHREYFTFNPQFKVLLSTNEIPHIRSQGFSLKRRLKLIPFNQRFYDPQDDRIPKRDDNLISKLLAERSGILNWMVRGCLQWQESGLMTPNCVKLQTEEFFENQDPLAEFLESICNMGPDCEVKSSDLWEAYVEWCRAGDRKPVFRQSNSFCRNLVARDDIESKRTHEGRFLEGISLRSHVGCDGYDADFAKSSHEERIELLPESNGLSDIIRHTDDPLSMLGDWGQPDPEYAGEVF